MNWAKRSVQRVLAACVLGVALQSTGAAAERGMQPVSPDSQIEFEVFLPLKDEAALDLLLRAQQDQTSPLYRHWLTPAEFAARFGAAADSVERVKQALAARGLNVTATHPQGMHVVGRADAVSSTFSTPLVRVLDGAGRYRIKGSRALTLPAELANEGATVAAFSPVPARHVDSRVVPDVGVAGGDNRISATGSYWFTDLKQAYDFPTYQALTGRGTTIAIVMSSDYLDSDMEMYFGHEKLAPPHIERVPVLGGAPFSTNNGASYEVSLDIQQSGGMAPNATIRLYNIPDLSDNSVLTAYNQIVQENIADIVSSSFSGPEAGYLPSYNGGTDYTPILTQTYESIFKQGNAQGITFVSSSGDSGGLPIPSVDYFNSPPSPYARFVPGVEHPASSPSVTGVGGTNLVTAYIPGSLDSSYVGENAYGDPEIPYDPYGQGVTVSGGYWGSGGGVSQIFSRPRFQTLVPTHSHMRTVPDISLQEGGCPEGLAQLPCGTPRSSVVAAVGGQYVALIGTSASAPEFAGLLGVLEESFGGRVGNVNYLLYAEGAAQARDPFLQFFRDRQAGFNGYEYTQPVYNQVLGLGTPRAKNIMLRPELPSAGVPQTPSNP